MSAKFIPGPWAYNGKTDVYTVKDGGTVCELYSNFSRSEEGKATARLIAAAPDLLEALEVIKTIATPPRYENAFPAIVGIAQAAISKAKGGANE